MSEMSAAQQLLKRMAEVGRTSSYKGTFTYEQGGVLKTFRVFHTVKDGKEYERLVHLSGPSAEVVRQGNPVGCSRTGDLLLRGGIVESSIGHGHLDDFYHLSIQGEDRVAGRTVIELHVIPKDQLRYGYVLSIDKQSGLLLRAIMVAENRKQVLERFQFVDVSFGAEISTDEVMSTEVAPMVADVNGLPCVRDDRRPALGLWNVGWVPEGFVLVDVQPGAKKASETLMFSDGLGFFSVFIDNGPGLQLPLLKAKRGATVAVMDRATLGTDEYAVCVVGEIPTESAARIAQSVGPQQQ